jgi:cytochrome c oxidase subunit 2
VDAEASAAATAKPRVQFAAMATSENDTGIAGAESPFEYWQYKQVVPAPGTENVELITRGRQLFADKKCSACHSIRTRDNAATNLAPDLTHFGSRTTIAAATLENTPTNLRAWITNPELVKPGNFMWHTPAGAYVPPVGYNVWNEAEGKLVRNIELTDEEVDALATYLESLK